LGGFILLYKTVIRKKCAFCGEMIDSDLNRCPYCCTLLPVKARRTMAEEPDSQSMGPSVVFGDNFMMTSMETRGEDSEPLANSDEDAEFDWEEPETALANGLKVFITSISSVLPGLGQVIGLITGITFTNSDEKDRRSFGTALIVDSIIMFILWSILIFVLLVFFSSVPQ